MRTMSTSSLMLVMLVLAAFLFVSGLFTHFSHYRLQTTHSVRLSRTTLDANRILRAANEAKLRSLLSHATRKPSDPGGSSLSGATKPARGKGIRHHRQRAGLNFVQHRSSETGRTDLPEVLQVFVITFADEANEHVCDLLWSAMKFNISVSVLNSKAPANAGTETPVAASFASVPDLRRLDALEKELQPLAADYPGAIILWLDADMIFQQPLETAVRAFVTIEQLGDHPPMVWSGQKACWPVGALCDVAKYAAAAAAANSMSQPEYIYPHIGAALGHMWAYVRFFSMLHKRMLVDGYLNPLGFCAADFRVQYKLDILKDGISYPGADTTITPQNTQELVQALLFDSDTNGWIGPMGVDRYAQVFFSLELGGAVNLAENGGRGPQDFVIYRHARTGVTPAILNFNGLSQEERDRYYRIARQRLEPKEFQEAVLRRSDTVLHAPRSLSAGCSRFWQP